VCRAALLAAIGDPSRLLLVTDSSEYAAIAHNIDNGRGFSADAAPPFRPDIRRTPIYPLILAAVFRLQQSGLRLAALVSVMAGAAAAAATCLIAWHLFGPGPALVAGLLLAIDAGNVGYSVMLLTDEVFSIFLLAGVAMLVRRPMRPASSIASGVLLGAAALCRPAGLLLGPVSYPALAWRAPTRKDAVRAYVRVNVVFAAIVLAWIGRNALVSGSTTLSSVGAVNLYFHRAAGIEAWLQGRDAGDVRTEWEARFAAMSAGWSESEKSEWLTARAREIIAAHPGVYARLTVDGIVRMFSTDVEEICLVFDVREDSTTGRAFAHVQSLQLWIVYPAALLGLAAALRDPARRRAILIPVAFIGYFGVVSAGPEAYARFRVPIMPFVAMLSGSGLHRLYSSVRGDS